MRKAFISGWARRALAKFDPKSKANPAYCRACQSISIRCTRKSLLVGNIKKPLFDLRSLIFDLSFEVESVSSKIKDRRSESVWDTKRQIIWLVVGISFGTFIVYMDAHDEAGRFDRSVFAFWEIILLAIILTLFYLYSRKKT